MKIFLFCLGLLFTSVSSLAADRCTTWGCISIISELYTNSSGIVYIGTPFDEKLADCTTVSNKYFSLNMKTNEGAKEVYSSMLAAYISGKKIQLRVKPGHSRCELAYVRLNTNF